VKICSIYGAGFFYIPGTDTCIKIGGWVRAEMDVNAGGSHSAYIAGGGGRNNRIDSADVQWRSRFVTSFDIRTQTEYGTLRAYTRAGFQWTTNEDGIGTYYVERTFIQFAGFTVGRSQSYFDFYANAMYYTGYIGGPSSTGAAGQNVFAYTATFGNGFTATLSVEDGTLRRSAVWDAGTDALTVGALPGPSTQNATGYTARSPGVNIGDYAAAQVPDIVGSLRVDQAWGSAQIAGALHQVRAGYYGNNNTLVGNAAGPGQWTGMAPSDKWGYAVMGGLVLNLPWAKGDQFWVEGAYTVGAVSYTGFNQNGQYSNFLRFNGGTVGTGIPLDAVFANLVGPGVVGLAGSGLELTTVWTIGASLQHYWTPALRSSVFGAWNTVDYTANATAMYCSSPVGYVRTAAGATPNFATGPVAGCNPDFNLWGVGTRTIWNPVPNLDIGVEVVYTKLEQKNDPNTVRLNFAGAGGRAQGLYTPADQEVWSGILRIQRNFFP
jgi:Porin subfamily